MCCCTMAPNGIAVSENEGHNLTLRAALSQLMRSILNACKYTMELRDCTADPTDRVFEDARCGCSNGAGSTEWGTYH